MGWTKLLVQLHINIFICIDKILAPGHMHILSLYSYNIGTLECDIILLINIHKVLALCYLHHLFFMWLHYVRIRNFLT